MLLSDQGFKVLHAGSAADTLEMCRRHRPTVVLLDDGIAVPPDRVRLLDDLRLAHPDVRLCLVSAGGDYNTEHLNRIGIAAFFGKPFTIDQLVQTLERLCTDSA